MVFKLKCCEIEYFLLCGVGVNRIFRVCGLASATNTVPLREFCMVVIASSFLFNEPQKMCRSAWGLGIGQFHAESVLPKKAIEEFKRVYKKSYNIELTDEEAADKANRLVRLYQAVYSDPAFGRVEIKKKSDHEAQ